MPPESSSLSRIEQILTDVVLAIRNKNDSSVDANGWRRDNTGSATIYTKKIFMAAGSDSEIPLAVGPVGVDLYGATSYNVFYIADNNQSGGFSYGAAAARMSLRTSTQFNYFRETRGGNASGGWFSFTLMY